MLAGMPLTNAIPTGFIPTANAEAARAFYEGTLGLRFVADEPKLAAKGVQFLRYPGMEQDESGIWHAPGRAKLVWFQDPDGNTLSIAQHSA